jgi:hypothetical protein
MWKADITLSVPVIEDSCPGREWEEERELPRWLLSGLVAQVAATLS